MDLEKYGNLVYQRIRENFQTWSKTDSVTEKDIYFFLQKIKGTAGAIGLTELMTIATKKLAKLDGDSEQLWSKKQWSAFLGPLMEMQSFHDKNNLSELEKWTNKESMMKEFILIIDDDIVFIAYLKNILEAKGYSVIVAHNGKRGLELIYELQPAIVFLDIMLPDTDGFSILNNIESIKKDRTFITIISSFNERENKVRAYELGAMDFISKPIDKDILIAYVENRLAYRKELEYAVLMDELTQVYNRKFLESQLHMLTEEYKNNKDVFTVAVMDLDFFKQINDTHGHLIGDEVLKGFAQLVMDMKRSQDIFCRYGGEEFVLLMPNTTKEEAHPIIEKLRQLFEKKMFIGSGKFFRTTFSSGIMDINDEYTHEKKLFEAADKALYVAKEAGRNKIVLFNPTLETVKNKVKLRVIVVDDVNLIRQIIIRHFAELPKNDLIDIEVLAFDDGLKFLEADWFEPGYKYVILLDWMLPNMNGIDILKEIRKKYSSKDVIVSMLTGRTGEEYVLEAFRNGADDYILKPFQIGEVSARILNLAERIFTKG